MSVTWEEKRCQIPLDEEWVEGLDTGLFEDIKYRPNKYFHPIEEILLEEGRCTIIYQRDLMPVDGKIPLTQVLQVLEGAVDATQRLAQDQVFYLYPDVDAFIMDRRRNLRIGLINVRPIKDRERTSQEMCVDAFCQLLAAHCPEGHRRVVAYNKPILTLRHLQQVLTRRGSSPLLMSFLVLLLLMVGSYAALSHWGPPRVKKTLNQWTMQALSAGKRVLRSGTEEWHAEARKERQKREYSYPPVPFTLVIEPHAKDPREAALIYQKLSALLLKEFPPDGEPRIPFQLLVPDATKFPKAYARWKRLCAMAFSRTCAKGSWLLHFPSYPGGWRPLIETIRESVREARSRASGRRVKKSLLTARYVSFVGLLDLGLKTYHFGPERPKVREKQGTKKRVLPRRREGRRPAPTTHAGAVRRPLPSPSSSASPTLRRPASVQPPVAPVVRRSVPLGSRSVAPTPARSAPPARLGTPQ